MAGSRTFTNTCSGNHGSHYTQNLIVNWDDYDITNNRTYLRINYTRTRDSGYYNYGYDNPSQINIDGSQVASANPTSAHNTQITQTLCTYEGWVYHNNDGTKTINVSASFSSTSSNLSGGSVSGTVELPTIPRASDIGVNDANIGSNTTITINKKVDSFTTDLYWRVQGDSSWISIGTTSQYSYAWTVPTSLYSRIPNAKTIKCEFRGVTKSGSTTIGEKTTTATFTATGNPIINTITAIDTNSTTTALTGDNTKMIRYASNVKITINASAQNSATIKTITVNNNLVSNNTITFNKATTNSFNVTVVDTRDYSKSQTKTITMVNYVPLTLNATITRNTPTDGKININYNGNYFNGSFGSQSNTLTVQYRSRVANGTWGSWTNLSPTISGNTYSQTTTLSGYDYTKQYEFQIRTTDKIETKTIAGINVPKGKPVYDWDEDSFNVNGDLTIEEVSIFQKMYPVGSIYMSVNNTNPSTYFGGTWVAWGSGRVPVGVNTSDTEFSTVEKTGGSKDMQKHSHTRGTMNITGQIDNLTWDNNVGFYGITTSGAIIKRNTYPQGRILAEDSYWGSGSDSAALFGFDASQNWTGNTSEEGTGNSGNLQPYITCFMWKRVS